MRTEHVQIDVRGRPRAVDLGNVGELVILLIRCVCKLL